MIQSFLAILLLAGGAEARASSFSCSGASSWSTSTTVGMPGIVNSNMLAQSGQCVISTNVGASYTAGASYTITVTSSPAQAQKLVASAGSLSGGNSGGDSTCQNTYARVTSTAFTWVAPSAGSGTVNFYSICGGQNPGVYLASPLAVSEAAVPTSNPSVAPTSSPITTPTSSPTECPITSSPLAAGQTATPTTNPSTGQPFATPTASPAVVTSSPTTASPATNAPSVQPWSVTLVLGIDYSQATAAFKSDFMTRMAADLGIATSAFDVTFSPGSVVALVTFTTASNGASPSQAASTLSGRSASHLSTALQTTVSSVSSASVFTGTPSPTSGQTACYLAALTGSALYKCSYSPDGTDFEISWSHNETHIKLRLQADTDGWVGLGYGTSQMVTSYASIGWCSSGVADVEEYHMTGKSTGSVNQGGNELSYRACTEINGRTTVDFVRALSGTTTISTSGDTDCIWAQGSTDSLSQHASSGRGVVKINFGTGTGSTVEEVDYILAHSVCMWLGMCFFFIIGISSARYLKADETQIMSKPKWLFLHIVAQCMGAFFMIVGFGLGYASVAKDNDEHFSDDTSKSHGRLGLALFVVSLIQIVGGMLRPHKDPDNMTTMRKIWQFGHKFTGVTIVLLALINVLLGLKLADSDKTWFYLQYVWIALWLLGEIFFLVVSCKKEDKIGSTSPNSPAYSPNEAL